MIQFRRIDITSYKSIFHCSLDFEQLENGLYSLEGVNNTVNFAQSNGSGKSTLINAIMFALYGTTEDSSVKKADYQNKNTRTKLNVKLDLNIQGKNYSIERTDKEFKLFREGEDISELTKTDTEKKFQDILNLSKAEFCNFTYLAQNGSGSFLSKTPSEKLNCIKDFIFGEDLQDLQNVIVDLISETKSKLDTADRQCASLSGSINALNDVFSSKDKVIEIFPYSLDEYKTQLKTIEERKKAFIRTQANYRENKILFSNYKSKLESIKQDFDKAKSNICPTCGQELQDNSVIDNLRQKAKKIKEQATEVKQQLLAAETALNAFSDDEDYDKTIKEIHTIIAKIEQQTTNNYNYDEIEQNIADKREQLLAVEKLKSTLEFKLQQLNKLNKYFKTDFIAHIQQAFLSEIENYLNLYCYDVFEEEFKLRFSNNSLEVLVGEHPISYFSGGEQQRLNTIFLFAIKVALMSLTNKTTNLLILDESLSGSDSEAFENCIELISNLTKAENLTTILVSHRDVDYQMNKIIIERFDNKTKLSVIKV